MHVLKHIYGNILDMDRHLRALAVCVLAFMSFLAQAQLGQPCDVDSP
jgi:hypothetical protein